MSQDEMEKLRPLLRRINEVLFDNQRVLNKGAIRDFISYTDIESDLAIIAEGIELIGARANSLEDKLRVTENKLNSTESTLETVWDFFNNNKEIRCQYWCYVEENE